MNNTNNDIFPTTRLYGQQVNVGYEIPQSISS